MKKVLLIEIAEDGVMRYIGELDDNGQLSLSDKIPPATEENSVATETVAPTVPVDESPRTAAALAANQDPVKLDPKDPEFEAQKTALKKMGYRYVGKYQAWYPPREKKAENSEPSPSQFENWWGNAPAVGLSKDDPDFGGKMAALKKAGYRWNKTLSLWQSPQQ